MRALSCLDVAFMAPEVAVQAGSPHFNNWGLGMPFVDYSGVGEFWFYVI